MKKIIIIMVLAVAVAGVIGVSAFNKDADKTVGYLDGKAINVAELQNYVDTVLGDNYKNKLETEEGRTELFNHYINRTLLLAYAQENVEEGDTLVNQHTLGDVDSDSAKLTAVLKNEINDKVSYTEQDVRELMASDSKYKSLEDAERAIISQKRIELFNALMDRIKADHKITLEG